MNTPLTLPCPACNGDGFVSYEDRHTETAKEVCPVCRGYETIAAETGAKPDAAFDTTRTGPVQALFQPDPGTEWTITTEASPEGVFLVISFTLYGAPATLKLAMDRPDARTLSAGLLAAAGDAAARTVPATEVTEAQA